jgi:magnesium transporter
MLIGGQVRVQLTPEEMRHALDSGDGLLWVDVHEWDPASVGLLRDVFRFHQLAIEDCFNDRVDSAKIDDYGEYLFIVSQHVAYSARSDHLRLTELNLFLGPNYVVTVHQRAVGTLHEIFRRAAHGDDHVLEKGADFLAHSILDRMVDDLLPAVEEMDEKLNTLERRILERPDRTQLTEVLLFKRNAIRLRRAILSQRDIANRLSRNEYSRLVSGDALIFYRDIYDHVVRVEEMLEGLRDLADSALSSYMSATNNRMNEVMMAMSVVAVIFLPLTLVASIFGTNLDYSPFGLTLEAGFYVMLAAMAAIAALMVAYFRSRGWF